MGYVVRRSGTVLVDAASAPWSILVVHYNFLAGEAITIFVTKHCMSKECSYARN